MSRAKLINEEHMGTKNTDTRVALLEQSIGHIQQSLDRIEKRFDSIDIKFDKFDAKLIQMDAKIDSNFKYFNDKVDSKFMWTLLTYFGGFGALFGILAHIQGWY